MDVIAVSVEKFDRWQLVFADRSDVGNHLTGCVALVVEGAHEMALTEWLDVQPTVQPLQGIARLRWLEEEDVILMCDVASAEDFHRAIGRLWMACNFASDGAPFGEEIQLNPFRTYPGYPPRSPSGSKWPVAYGVRGIMQWMAGVLSDLHPELVQELDEAHPAEVSADTAAGSALPLINDVSPVALKFGRTRIEASRVEFRDAPGIVAHRPPAPNPKDPMGTITVLHQNQVLLNRSLDSFDSTSLSITELAKCKIVLVNLDLQGDHTALLELLVMGHPLSADGLRLGVLIDQPGRFSLSAVPASGLSLSSSASKDTGAKNASGRGALCLEADGTHDVALAIGRIWEAFTDKWGLPDDQVELLTTNGGPAPALHPEERGLLPLLGAPLSMLDGIVEGLNSSTAKFVVRARSDLDGRDGSDAVAVRERVFQFGRSRVAAKGFYAMVLQSETDRLALQAGARFLMNGEPT